MPEPGSPPRDQAFAGPPPSHTHLRVASTASTIHQRDQDVRAAIDFSRARSGTLPSPPDPPAPRPDPSDADPARPEPDARLFRPPRRSPTPRASPGPAFEAPLIDLGPPAHPPRRSSSHCSLDSIHGALIDHRPPPLPPPAVGDPPRSPDAQPAPGGCSAHSPARPPASDALSGPSTQLRFQDPGLGTGRRLGSGGAHRSRSRSRSRWLPSEPQARLALPLARDTVDRRSLVGSSRRPSDAASEDVCFPRLEAGRALARDLAPLHLADTDQGTRSHGPAALAGMLPHFPYPFDFEALEHFAVRERETLRKPSSAGPLGESAASRGRSRSITILNQPPESAGFAPAVGDARWAPKGNTLPLECVPPEWNSSALSDGGSGGSRFQAPGHRARSGHRHFRHIRSFSFKSPCLPHPHHGDKADDGLGRPGVRERIEGILKARPTGGSHSLGSSRRAARVAMFEGPPPPSPPKRGHSRSPRLSRKPTRNESAGTNFKDHFASAHGLSGLERPYRFSFYSNALPSTLHARSLAELPGQGRTFEELFVGTRRGAPEAGPSDLELGAPDKGETWLSNGRSGDLDGGQGEGIASLHEFDPISRVETASRWVQVTHQDHKPDKVLQAPPVHSSPQLPKAGKPRSEVLMRTDEDAEANTWWLDVLSPTDQEMKLLSKVFGIHPLTTEDIQMEETREKIELFRNYYLVCFRSFDQDPYSPTYLEPLNVYIIVFREGTLSFHFRGTPHPQNVRRRIKQLKDYINVTSDWISYALIDDITDAFGPLIQSIEYEVDSIDELVLIMKDAEQSDMLRRIGTCRKKVMGLLRLMGNKADVVRGLSKRCNENWLVAPKSDIGLYLSDIQDHLVTMTQNLNHYEKILSRSHSNYLAQISIEMTDANNQINDVLSKLTALGSILVPMNLVTGLWGMNVHVPGQDVTEGYAWFISIVCGLVTFGIVGAWATLRYFKFSKV